MHVSQICLLHFELHPPPHCTGCFFTNPIFPVFLFSFPIFLSFVLLFFCLFGFLHFSSFHCIMCFSGAFWSCAGRTNRWVGWSSWVIGFLRAPSVLVNCNNQVKRALLGLLVLSTCGFLAAFFATSKGNMMCVFHHTRQWKRQEQMVPDIKQIFEKLPRGVEESCGEGV